ncbi:hypothetical protein B0T26DRAFT_729878 [Lasiosphaeria miniovina]|uniref:Uncharacterized protein n=1 Tax=Lasiosphaeria miniovina TaxID=1954250 RepID=A0AA39ZT23_9PEZI|nr:uncharacterized protein B0T26DRAFT_729878 [Lasiosphaeria miniovina]KAK0703127.1 hypothetical protein B0T26DRAFT_729878 [Lasiosphaeria miniovina]
MRARQRQNENLCVRGRPPRRPTAPQDHVGGDVARPRQNTPRCQVPEPYLLRAPQDHVGGDVA